MIRLKNVTSGYKNAVILRDISASFEKGRLTGIIGKNGCGKSTLLKTILRIIPCMQGEITIDEKTLAGMSRNDIAQKIALLSQEKSTPDMTAGQLALLGRFPHLRYPRRYHAKDYEIAQSAMQQMGVLELNDKPLVTLSGGMRQNAFIAMALAQETDYILLDEPTTHLDISHQLALMKTLRLLTESGKGVVAVMHDLPLALTFSDNILVINDGSIEDSGAPEEIFRRETLNRLFSVALARTADGNGYYYRY